MKLAHSLLVLTCFCLFLFSRTTGNLSIKQDDVYFITRDFFQMPSYWKMIGVRGYLTPFYSWVYDLVGQDNQRTHIFYFVCLYLSGVLFLLVARRLLAPAPALLSAMFYLAYTGKMETVTWSSAGAYLVVMIAFFLSVLLAMSEWWGPWRRALLITAIHWAAVHLYEFAAAAAPLYPLLYVMYQRLRRRAVDRRHLAATFLPLAMFVAHLGIMYLNRTPNPVWLRNPHITSDPVTVVAAAWNTFHLAIRTTLFYRHFSLLQHLRALTMTPWTWWFVASFVLAAALFAHHWRTHRERSCDPAVFWTAAAGSVWLVLLTPVMGLTASGSYFPSRLLSLNGAGLAMLAGLAVSWTGPRLRRALLGAVLAVLLMESLVFNTILSAAEMNWAYTRHIRSELVATGVKLRVHDVVFLSLPDEHPAWGKDRIGEVDFEWDWARYLLMLDFNLLKGDYDVHSFSRITYTWERRRQAATRFPVEEQYLSAPGRMLPFFIRQSDHKPVAIRRVEWLDENGRIARAIDFPRVAHLPSPMVARVPVRK